LQKMKWFRVVLDEGQLSSSLIVNSNDYCNPLVTLEMPGY
jgi:hypothetical protein